MKVRFCMLIFGLCACCWLTGPLLGQEKQTEVTLNGKITCAKCELELTKRCASVIVVKESDKEVVYYFDAASNKKYHAETCSQSREGEVVGTVSEVDGKKTIAVTRLKFKEKEPPMPKKQSD